MLARVADAFGALEPLDRAPPCDVVPRDVRSPLGLRAGPHASSVQGGQT